MSGESDIDRIIASMASGDSVDWGAAREQVGADEQACVDALQGIERIAAFSQAQREKLAPFGEPAFHLYTAALAGRTVGAYTLESLIGEGGMGAVWLARRSDGRFEGRAAVKFLHLPRASRDGLARFEREGQILARLRHTNIAQLLDAGVTADGQPYLVLEHVDGMPIDRYCETQGLGVRGRIEVFLQVLRAVAYAQINLVLHRDLKPANILVDHAGSVKLLDFGIAKLLEAEGNGAATSELTQRAGRAFTPEYAAPEQLRGDAVTTATDVYGAGLVLYVLLTGVHPAAGALGSPVERVQAILESTPKAASEALRSATEVSDVRSRTRLRRELQGDLDNILSKALKKVPEERYANAEAFADDLRRYLSQEPVAARADTITYRVGKFVRRHRAGVASATLAILALLTLTGVTVAQLLEARRQRDAARAQTRRAEAFNSVVTSLLSQVGPGGRALSPEELLDRAVHEMEATYADDPEFLVDMLIRISGRYLDLRNNVKELATLERAESIARRAGARAAIFDVQVNTVETELALGHKQQAKARIEEARRLLPTLDPTPPPHEYLRAEAEVAKANGDVAAALGYLEQGRRALEDAGQTAGNSYAGLLSVLRLFHTLDGNVRVAHDYALQMVDLHRRHDREQSAAGITSRAVLAVSFASVGEVARAGAMFEAAVPEVVDWRPGAALPLLSLDWMYGEIASRLGHHDLAVGLIRESLAAVIQSGNRMNMIRARLALTRALLRTGNAVEAQQTLDLVVAGIMADESANRMWLPEASRLQAEVHLAQRQMEAAAQAATQALERLGYPEKSRGLALPQALVTLGRVRLAQKRAPDAVVALRAGLQMFEKDAIEPAGSADVGETLLALAQAQLAAGDAGGARQSVARAMPALRNGLGTDHELTHQSNSLALELR